MLPGAVKEKKEQVEWIEYCPLTGVEYKRFMAEEGRTIASRRCTLEHRNKQLEGEELIGFISRVASYLRPHLFSYRRA